MKNTENTDMLEIIFAGKNKAYGAYQIRRSYPNYLLRAFLTGVTIIFGCIALTRLMSGISETNTSVIIVEPIMPVTVKTPEKQPQPKLKIAAPLPTVKQTFRYVPPKILPNELVEEKQSRLTVDSALAQLKAPGKISTTGNGEDTVPEFPGEGNFYEPPSARKQAVDTVMDIITVEKMPSFPGGDAALRQFIRENLEYPEMARDINIMGTVALSFVVGKDGKIDDVKIIKDIGGGCGKEAIRVVKMMPRWIPGEANGYPVKVRFTLPVRFRLE